MSTSEKTAAGVSTPSLLFLLPQDVLVQLLSKLPAKLLVRLRCVSKFFCTLIADHGFGVLYRSLSLTLPSRGGILIALTSTHSSPAYYTINFSEVNPWRPGMLQANRLGYLDSKPLRKGCIRSSSEGLICLSRPNGQVVVCNVSMGHRIYLPRIQFHSALSYSPCALLGFDSESKRYKVLMSAWRGDRRQICFEYKHWILTIGVDKSWREINYSSDAFYPFDGYSCPGYSDTSVHIDGVIYSYNWLTRDVPPTFHIVAFDVGSESYSLIPIPAEVPSSSRFHSIDAFGEKYYSSRFVLRNFALLQVDGGRLAMVYFCKVGHLFYMHVWIWEKSKECWEKITMPIPLEESRTINGVKCRTGEIVLLFTNSKQFSILVCNLKSEVWKKFDVGGVNEFPFCFPMEFRMYKTMDNAFSIE